MAKLPGLSRAIVLTIVLGALSGALGISFSPLTPSPAFAADLAAAKATVDAAKAQGVVGEKGDGFLGLVNGSADPKTADAVRAINDGRAAVYRQTATQTGVSTDAAGEAAAKLLLERVPSGQYYQPLGGSWTRK